MAADPITDSGVVLKGHLGGNQIVLDEPVPESIRPDTPVTVTFKKNGSKLLQSLAKLARPGGLPRDFSDQFEHYTKGLPRR